MMICNVPTTYFTVTPAEAATKSGLRQPRSHEGHFIINDHPETARAEGQIVPQAKFFRIMVSKRVFYLPELIIFLIRNHQVMHEIPPGDAERPPRHLWLRAW